MSLRAEIPPSGKRPLNSEIVLVFRVQLIYGVIHQVDYQIGQNRQIQSNCDCQGHNGTDITCPDCVRTSLHFNYLLKVAYMV